jgi:hypothetical protein
VFYEKCDIDIFQALENYICRYKYNGRIYVMGDMNSRTGERDYFINCDEINHIIPNAPSVLNYESETRLLVWSPSHNSVRALSALRSGTG